ncbi:MAG: hypothetical protein ACK4FL_03510, partial [Microgenomates group bacterium]
MPTLKELSIQQASESHQLPQELGRSYKRRKGVSLAGLFAFSSLLAGCNFLPQTSTPTPTPESITYSDFFGLLENLPALNNNPEVQKLTATQDEFLKNFPQAQFGEKIILGIDNPDYVLRSFVNEKGEPTGLGIVTYFEKDRQPTTRIVAEIPPFVVDDKTSSFAGQVAAGLVVLDQATTEKIVNSKEPIAINITQDGDFVLLLMVLEKGVTWNQLIQQLSTAPNEQARAQILSSAISQMVITNPEDGHLYSLPTEFKAKVSDLLIPVSYQSSPPAPQPKETPTPTPTETPTPIPTLPAETVGGIEGIPDPKITNPELFNLQKPDAPIPQFVNAMKMAGIEVTGEEVAQGITYQQLKDKDGKPFIVAVYNLDPNPSKQGETLEGPIPLMIWDKEGGWDVV